ncbi:Arylsulfatase [Anatilimnocola aggregata]|uniref:Arylsulfatase n=1 Tax=Anatilimnocola aggregata TaxID=2528021 RepID=A0A517YE85_9BACT|nr:arylsulfatase [Anatilimnocola aggregata]QDU28538.1 Arylsulfatase [Anatilimnocola aggregata]
MRLLHNLAVLIVATAVVGNASRQLHSAEQTAAPQQPNIVFVLADDFGYGDAGCFNPESKIPTPNIDRLAKEGMKFTDAHSGSAVCSPTRYGILTGRYAWRTHLRRGVLGPYDPPLIAADRPTVASLLKGHGYHTACIGKWHLGWDWPRQGGEVVFDQPIKGGPTARGFDRYFGTDVPNYPPYCFIDNERTVGQPTDMKTVRDLNGRLGPMLPGWQFDAILPKLTEQAVEYIGTRAREKQPFFLYFPLTSPHEPIAPSARFKGKSGINDLADFFMESDWAVGEIITALEKYQLADNTLFIFTCDNGHATYTGLPPLQQAGHKVSGPFRGYKTDIWEGGHRVPFVARWPGKIKAGTTCDETICHTNLLATSLDVIGASRTQDVGEDSFSIWPLLQGKQLTEPTHPYVVHQAANGMLAIRQGKWKLLVGAAGDATKGNAREQLYDLDTDPGEVTDLAAANPAVVERLLALLQKSIDDGRSTPGKPLKNDVAVRLRAASVDGKKKK